MVKVKNLNLSRFLLIISKAHFAIISSHRSEKLPVVRGLALPLCNSLPLLTTQCVETLGKMGRMVSMVT